MSNTDPKKLVDSPIFLSLPDAFNGAQRSNPETFRARHQWFQALRESHLNTLRSLASLLKLEASDCDHERLSLKNSIMDSSGRGLDFPKSPSQQLQHEVERKHAKLPLVDNVEEEREERGFWAKRFKGVYERMRHTYEGIAPAAGAKTLATLYYDANGRRRSSGAVI